MIKGDAKLKFRLSGLTRKAKRISPKIDAPDQPITAFSSPAERIKVTGQFGLDDINLLVETINQYDVVRGTPWDDFRGAHCRLPDWFRGGLDPFSDDYDAQQQRLW